MKMQQFIRVLRIGVLKNFAKDLRQIYFQSNFLKNYFIAGGFFEIKKTFLMIFLQSTKIKKPIPLQTPKLLLDCWVIRRFLVQDEIQRNLQMFFNLGVLKNVTKETLTQMGFFVNIAKFLRTAFLRTPPVVAFRLTLWKYEMS